MDGPRPLPGDPTRLPTSGRAHIVDHSGDGFAGSIGLFESRALQTPGSATSFRDALTPGLRANYAFVTTPLVSSLAAQAPQSNAVPCPSMPCNIMLRPDLPLVDPDPTDVLSLYRDPSMIIASGGNPLFVDPAQGVSIDATSFLSPDLKAMLLAGQTQWLRPVEAGRVARAGADTTPFVALPSPWTAGAALIQAHFQNGIFTSNLRQGDDPGDRSGARGLFSTRENAVLLVGGSRDATHPTREVWRFDLAEQTWAQLVLTAPTVETVIALGWDTSRGQMVVLDVPAHAPFHPQHLRLLLVNLNERTTKVLGTFLRSPEFDRYSLTARGDGSYVLVASHKLAPKVRLARFSIDAAEKLVWTGLKNEHQGTLFDEPTLTDDGVVVPLLKNNKLALVTVTNATFGPCGGTPDVF